MKQPSALSALVEALRALPGVGPKSAQRMAYHLMQHDRAGAEKLGRALLFATEHLQHCESATRSPKRRSAKCAAIPSAIRRCCASSKRRPTRSCSNRPDLSRPLFRADGPIESARRHRPEGDPFRPADRARVRMASSRKSCSRRISPTKAKRPRITSRRRSRRAD